MRHITIPGEIALFYRNSVAHSGSGYARTREECRRLTDDWMMTARRVLRVEEFLSLRAP
jgi:hypothetical protein